MKRQNGYAGILTVQCQYALTSDCESNMSQPTKGLRLAVADAGELCSEGVNIEISRVSLGSTRRLVTLATALLKA